MTVTRRSLNPRDMLSINASWKAYVCSGNARYHSRTPSAVVHAIVEPFADEIRSNEVDIARRHM